MIIDTHAHYDDDQYNEDRDAVLKQMEKEQFVEAIVNSSSTISSWEKTLELTRKYSFVYGTIGVHPDEVGGLSEEVFARMKTLSYEDKIVAIGEIGLDYYWKTEEPEVQKKWFIRQLEFARERQLPVIIHSRDAGKDTLQIMKEHAKGLEGIIHCFSYSKEIALEYIKMGFYIGVGGVVTFPNGRKLKEVVQEIGLDRIVLETDCPYLAPVPFRGKRNVSSLLSYVVKEIANLKDVSEEEVMRQTIKNAKDIYKI